MLHHNAVTVLLTLHFPVSNAPIVFLALFVNYCLYLHNPFSFALIMSLQYLMYVIFLYVGIIFIPILISAALLSFFFRSIDRILVLLPDRCIPAKSTSRRCT